MNDQPEARPRPRATTSPSRCGYAGRSAQRLLDAGRAAPTRSPSSAPTRIREIRETYDAQELEPDTHTGEQVAVTGRVIFLRNTGKLCFARLREGDGTELQVMLSLADVGEESLADFKALVDIGDLLAVRGEVVTSRRGELSVQATDWAIAAKTLRPLPNEHRPLSDEARIRLRYVDMMVRPEAREMVRTKATVLQEPARAPSTSAATSRSRRRSSSSPTAAPRPGRSAPTSTRSTRTMLLRIALELDLKRAMIGGVDRVYEIGRTFRNEGLDSTHAAEFSMLEAYEAYGDQFTMMDADQGAGASTPPGPSAAPSSPAATAPRSTSRASGARPRSSTWSPRRSASEVDVETDAETLRKLRRHARRGAAAEMGAAEIVVELYEQLVEDTLINPTFVMDYPAAVKPLAKPHRSTAGPQRGLGPDHQRRRAGAGVLRAQRPGGGRGEDRPSGIDSCWPTHQFLVVQATFGMGRRDRAVAHRRRAGHQAEQSATVGIDGQHGVQQHAVAVAFLDLAQAAPVVLGRGELESRWYPGSPAHAVR